MFVAPVAVAAACAAGLGSGCSKKVSPLPDGPSHSVRGQIEGLPVAGDARTFLRIHHEEIPGWAYEDGRTGMAAMVMPFPIDPGVSLEGIAVGDTVAFVVKQTPSTQPPWVITSITKLPAGTVLDFSGRGEPR